MFFSECSFQKFNYSTWTRHDSIHNLIFITKKRTDIPSESKKVWPHTKTIASAVGNKQLFNKQVFGFLIGTSLYRLGQQKLKGALKASKSSLREHNVMDKIREKYNQMFTASKNDV